MIRDENQMDEAAICRCKHPKLYHMFSTVTNVKTGKITPIEFCLECECIRFREDMAGTYE